MEALAVHLPDFLVGDQLMPHLVLVARLVVLVVLVLLGQLVVAAGAVAAAAPAATAAVVVAVWLVEGHLRTVL